jgi:hypothetical protein
MKRSLVEEYEEILNLEKTLPRRKEEVRESIRKQYLEDFISDIKEKHKGRFLFDQLQTFQFEGTWKQEAILKNDGVKLTFTYSSVTPKITVGINTYEGNYTNAKRDPTAPLWTSRFKNDRDLFRKISFEDWEELRKYAFLISTEMKYDNFENVLLKKIKA